MARFVMRRRPAYAACRKGPVENEWRQEEGK
jgi:hypothetical protein